MTVVRHTWSRTVEQKKRFSPFPDRFLGEALGIKKTKTASLNHFCSPYQRLLPANLGNLLSIHSGLSNCSCGFPLNSCSHESFPVHSADLWQTFFRGPSYPFFKDPLKIPLQKSGALCGPPSEACSITSDYSEAFHMYLWEPFIRKLCN